MLSPMATEHSETFYRALPTAKYINHFIKPTLKKIYHLKYCSSPKILLNKKNTKKVLEKYILKSVV